MTEIIVTITLILFSLIYFWISRNIEVSKLKREGLFELSIDPSTNKILINNKQNRSDIIKLLDKNQNLILKFRIKNKTKLITIKLDKLEIGFYYIKVGGEIYNLRNQDRIELSINPSINLNKLEFVD